VKPARVFSEFANVNGGFWPFSAIEDIDFQATSITAFWLGPELASIDGSLAAVDPDRNLDRPLSKPELRVN
jgi:hypothetical protein